MGVSYPRAGADHTLPGAPRPPLGRFAFSRVPPAHGGILLLNFCLNGRCEVNLDNGQFAFLSQGIMALGTQQAKEAYRYPSGIYEGGGAVSGPGYIGTEALLHVPGGRH